MSTERELIDEIVKMGKELKYLTSVVEKMENELRRLGADVHSIKENVAKL